MNKVSVLGIEITPTNLDETVKFIQNYDYRRPAYICFSDTSVASRAASDEKIRRILRHSLLALADGEPLVLSLRIKGYKDVSTVSGYWLIKSLARTNLRHYFYGASEAKCEALTANLKEENPDCQIIGYKSPPFEDLSNIENNTKISDDISEINQLKPDIVWIGISSPKQDYLMYHYHKYLDKSIMIGVGGVFDYLAGTHKISPEWIKKIGFRWLFRFIQDPKRLWKKYYLSFAFIIKYLILGIINKKNQNIN